MTDEQCVHDNARDSALSAPAQLHCPEYPHSARIQRTISRAGPYKHMQSTSRAVSTPAPRES
eukprot:2118480-Prymnesium_polylepis.1